MLSQDVYQVGGFSLLNFTNFDEKLVNLSNFDGFTPRYTMLGKLRATKPPTPGESEKLDQIKEGLRNTSTVFIIIVR